MLTEKYGFRHYMASVGIEVTETDLGERIQQLDNEDRAMSSCRQCISSGPTSRTC
jgi:L-lactate utilization protein LutB